MAKKCALSAPKNFQRAVSTIERQLDALKPQHASDHDADVIQAKLTFVEQRIGMVRCVLETKPNHGPSKQLLWALSCRKSFYQAQRDAAHAAEQGKSLSEQLQPFQDARKRLARDFPQFSYARAIARKLDAEMQRIKKKPPHVPRRLTTAGLLKQLPLFQKHPERMNDAVAALRFARTELRHVHEQLHASPPRDWRRNKGRTITQFIVRNRDLTAYLPLMTKESSLDPKTFSGSGAVGYFQMLPSTLEEINNFYGTIYVNADLQHPGKNCTIGILYLELLRHHYVRHDRYKGLSDHDRHLLAYAMYNAGPSTVNTLWDALRPRSYGDFEGKLSQMLVQKIGTAQAGVTRVPDAHQGVVYAQYPGVDQYLMLHARNDARLRTTVHIGTRDLPLRKVGEVLRYARMIEAFEGLPQTHVPAHAEKPVAAIPSSFLLRKEAFTLKRGIWSMAEDLRKELAQKKYAGISRGATMGARNEDRGLLLSAIAQFNREYNPALFDLNDQLTNIPDGVQIFIPTPSYIDRAKQTIQAEAAARAEQADIQLALPDEAEIMKTLPMYKDATLKRRGQHILRNTSGFDLGKVATYDNEPLYRNGPQRTKTTHLVLHSTETNAPDRGVAATVQRRVAHYVVDRQGTVYAVRDPDHEIDHAGRYKHQKAIWDGDPDISIHSIGIEVATRDGEAWSSQQYTAVKGLVHALGDHYDIPARNVVTHSQVAMSLWGRGRKKDPANIDWSKLDLPNNYLLVDRDVVVGRVAPNFWGHEHTWSPIAAADREGMIEGLRYSVTLTDQYRSAFANVRDKTAAAWRKAMEQRGTLSHTVQPGDSLWSVARTHATSVEAIETLNQLTTRVLSAGHILKIPRPKATE